MRRPELLLLFLAAACASDPISDTGSRDAEPKDAERNDTGPRDDERNDAESRDAEPEPDEDAGSIGADADAGVMPPGPTELRAGIQAILLRDDDGGRAVAITPAQIAAWIDYANTVFAAAHISFVFDPATDIIEHASTFLNSATGAEQPDWAEVIAEGNTLAARAPERLTILFRHGPDATPAGGGFSWTDYDFVVAPGFDVTVVCGRQNLELLAHELGHQLGLAHTFYLTYSSTTAAAEALDQYGELWFDGDAIDDTLLDPFVDTLEAQCGATSLELRGRTFQLPRDNVMSYYSHPAKTLTPEQATIVRQGLLLRTQQPLSLMFEHTATATIVEAETAQSTTTGGSQFPQEMFYFLGRWSNGEQLFWRDGEPGDELSVTVMIPAEANYDVYIAATLAPDYGVFDHEIDNLILEGPVDLFGRGVRPTGPIHLGTARLTPGPHVFTARVSGRNPANTSDAYFYGLDAILFAPR